MKCARPEAGARRPALSTPASSTPAESPRRPEPRPGRARARPRSLLPAVALLLGALSLFHVAPAQAQVPSAPTDLIVTPGDAKLGLRWDGPVGEQVTGYDVHYNATPINQPATTWVDDNHSGTLAVHDITSLTNGIRVRVRVRAKNAAGASRWAFASGTPALILKWPQATVSHAEGDTRAPRIRLKSDEVSQAVSGTVTYAPGSRNPATLADDLQTGYATTFSAQADRIPGITLAVPVNDRLNEAHETYTVTINAGTGYRVGTPATVTITIIDNDPPTAPAGLSLASGNRKLTASWSKPAGPVAGYQLRYKETAAPDRTASTPNDPSTGWVTSTPTGTGTSADVTGLTNWKAYHVQVRATDGQSQTGNGYGAWSASQTGTPQSPPDAPTGFVLWVPRPSPTSILLSWTAPADNGAAITAYELHYAPVGGYFQVFSNSDDVTATRVTITGLTPGTHYGIKVRARNSVGWGPFSQLGYFKTPISSPTNLKVTPGQRMLDLEWTAPVGPLQAYDVHYTSAPKSGTGGVTDTAAASGADPAVAWVAVTRSGTTASQTISGLSNGTTYRVRVRAKNSVITGSWAFKTGAPARPTVSFELDTLLVTETDPEEINVRLSWAQTRSVTVGISVKAGATATEGADYTLSAKSVTFAAGETEKAITLSTVADMRTEDNEVFTLVLTPPSGFGPGRDSEVEIVIVDDSFAVPALVANPGNGLLKLTWNDATSGDTEDGWDVHYTSAPKSGTGGVTDTAAASGSDPAAAWVAVTRTGTARSQTIRGLSNGTTYRLRVRWFDLDDDNMVTASGDWLLGSGTPAAVPDEPTNLAVAAGNAKLTLSWTAPSGTLTGYDVHFTSAAVGTVGNNAAASGSNPASAWVAVTRSGTTASQTISSLTNGTAYRVRVRAKNSAGNSTWVFGAGTPMVLPTVTLEVSPTSVNEGATFRVTVRLSTAVPSTATDAVTIPLVLTRDTLETGDLSTTHAAALNSGLAVSPGQSTNGYTATAQQDSDTQDEKFTVSLGTLPTGYDAGAVTSVVVTIVDDEVKPTLTFVSSTLTVTEGSTVDLRMTRTGGPAGAVIPVTVDLGTAETGDLDSDHLAKLRNMGFDFNLASTTVSTLPLGANQDLDTDEETLTVAIDTPRLAELGYAAGAVTSVTVTIDDDGVTIPVSLSAAPNPVAEGSSVTVTATLSKAAEEDVTIPVTLTDDTAESGDHGALTSIVVSAGSTFGTGTVTTAQDTDAEDERFTVTLGALPSGVVAGSVSSVAIAILDAEFTGSRVTLWAPETVDEGGVPVTVMATLSEAASSDVEIRLKLMLGTAEIEDFAAATRALLFDTGLTATVPAGEYNAYIELVTEHDAGDDDETFTVVIDAVNLPAGYRVGNPFSRDVTIDDDERLNPDPDGLTGLTIHDGIRELHVRPNTARDFVGLAGPEYIYTVQVSPGRRSVTVTPSWTNTDINGVNGTVRYVTYGRGGRAVGWSQSGTDVEVSLVDPGLGTQGSTELVLEPDGAGSRPYRILFQHNLDWESSHDRLEKLVMTFSQSQ